MSFFDPFAGDEAGFDHLLDVFSGPAPGGRGGGGGLDDRLSLTTSSGASRRGKELSHLPAPLPSRQADASAASASSSPRNTRKTKKPKDWSDFATGDASLQQLLQLDQQQPPQLYGTAPFSHQQQQQQQPPPQQQQAKKPRATSLKRKKADQQQQDLESVGGDDLSIGSADDGLDDYPVAPAAAATTTSGGGGGSSRSSIQAARERRRERNKVLARKTRVKKKVELETLRDQVMLLREENDRLKEIVRSKLPTAVGAHLLVECDIQLPENVAQAVQSMVDKAEVHDSNLFEKLKLAQRSFCISNAQARDQPIVYASPGFVELTGYPVAEILGRNCRFLQGKDTDRAEVQRLKDGIQKGIEVSVTLRNYRKDGTPFWNHIQVAPMVDHSGFAALVIGVQCEGPSGFGCSAYWGVCCQRDSSSNSNSGGGVGARSIVWQQQLVGQLGPRLRLWRRLWLRRRGRHVRRRRWAGARRAARGGRADSRRVSVRPSVCPSVFLSVCLSVDPPCR